MKTTEVIILFLLIFLLLKKKFFSKAYIIECRETKLNHFIFLWVFAWYVSNYFSIIMTVKKNFTRCTCFTWTRPSWLNFLFLGADCSDEYNVLMLPGLCSCGKGTKVWPICCCWDWILGVPEVRWDVSTVWVNSIGSVEDVKVLGEEGNKFGA